MATEKVHRTLTLRTAVSTTDFGARTGGPGTLQEALNRAHARLTTVPERRAGFEGQVIEGRNVREATGKVTLLHLVAYTPDDQISVVPDAGAVSQAALQLIDAPEDTEFLDGEIMALIKDNDVAICRSGSGERALQSYVIQLAQRIGMDSVDVSFQLMKRADMDKLEMIRREGIRRISMNALAHAASVGRVRRETVRESILGDAWEEIRALLGFGDRVPEDAENLKVEVMLTFDRRRGTEIDQRHIATLAERILADDEDEGFVIETLEGRKVRAQEIVLSKAVQIDAYGKSIHFEHAWSELRAFYDELSKTP